MKKAYIIILLVLFLCGCSKNENDKYKDFKHYSLEKKQVNYYTYYDERTGEPYEYGVADISVQGSEETKNGIFYKIGKNDFILLDEVQSCHNSETAYNNKTYTLFYKNKLYINRCTGGYVLEYILDAENTKKIDLYKKFTSKETNFGNVAFIGIIDVSEKTISYGAYNYNTYNEEKYVCSFDTYECKIIDE